MLFSVTNCWEQNRSKTLWKKVQRSRSKRLLSLVSCPNMEFSCNTKRLTDMCTSMLILSPCIFVCTKLVTGLRVHCCFWTRRRERDWKEILSSPIKLSSLKQQAASVLNGHLVSVKCGCFLKDYCCLKCFQKIKTEKTCQ